MTTPLTTLPTHTGWGTTARRDAWWVGPLLTVLGFSAFLIYGTLRAWMGDGYEIREQTGRDAFHKSGNRATAPYLSPFSSPLIYDPNACEHAWLPNTDLKAQLGLPGWFPFSAGFL